MNVEMNPRETLWCKYDFEVNKHHWRQVGVSKALPIRIKNLVDIAGIMDEAGVRFWLQGKTLLGAIRSSTLLDDHDDDIGADLRDRQRILDVVVPTAVNAGFQLIRNQGDMISLLREKRYIDICLFQATGRKYGYAEKRFPKRHFEKLREIDFLNRRFPVPDDPEGLLDVMYSPGAHTKFWATIRKLLEPHRYVRKARRAATRILFQSPHQLRRSIAWMFAPLGISYRKLSPAEFRGLLIEPVNSFNWKWRKPHLDIITDGQKARTVQSIIDFIGDEQGLDRLLSDVIETDTSKEFYEPHNFDAKFWQSGNNYFIYNVKYQFRKGVVEYSDANNYIRRGLRPPLFTAEFYASLPEMTDEEVAELFVERPIEIIENAVTSGKHRVCAMIGRIIHNKPYLPIYAVVRQPE